MRQADCPLCLTPGGTLLWQNEQVRVIDANDLVYPGFTRVVWQEHVAEMTDLSLEQQRALMEIVLRVERVQRTSLRPDKINLAAFGNQVPHLHWHIIARWADDAHFPQPVWATLPPATPQAGAAHEARRAQTQRSMPDYHRALRAELERPLQR